MKCGSGWTKNTENGDTFISIAIDETLQALYPALKDLSISLWHVKKEDRKNENSPSWTLTIRPKQEKETTTNSNEEIPM